MIGARIGPSIRAAIGAAIGPGANEIVPSDTLTPTTLTVTLTDSLDPIITSVNYTYSSVVTNTGSAQAVSVTATITLDASLTFVSGSGTGWTIGAVGRIVTCTRAVLDIGAAPTITITVTSGGSALTASSTADAIASNAPAAFTATQTTVTKLVSRDAAGAFLVPNTLTEWQDFNAYWVSIGLANFPNVTPASLYRCQEVSGDLADSIGAVTLTANGTPLYQQTVTNCTRKGVGFNEGANQRFTAASGLGPDPGTVSTLWLWRIDVTATPAAAGNILLVSDGVTNYRLLLSTTPRFQNVIAGLTTNGTFDPSAVSTQWVDIQDDKTNSKSTCHTSQEKITNTFSALVIDGRKGLGGATSWTGHAVYGVRFDGASGEITDAQIKALHTALSDGKAPAWT